MFKRWRNPDNVSIAGGEPLIYPHIVDLVALIKEQKIKPIILTNAVKARRTAARAQAGRAGRLHHPHRQPPGAAEVAGQERG